MEYRRLGDMNYIVKKYVNAMEGQAIFGISKSRIMEMAKTAGAVYKVGDTALINTEIFEAYLEKYRENPVPLPRRYVDKLKMMKYQWQVYRKVERINVFKSIYYLAYWAVMGVLKYR